MPLAVSGIERVCLRRVSPTLGFAEVRLAGVNLHDIRVEQGASRLTITAPTRQDSQGRSWPAYALQPGWREAIEREIAILWDKSTGSRLG